MERSDGVASMRWGVKCSRLTTAGYCFSLLSCKVARVLDARIDWKLWNEFLSERVHIRARACACSGPINRYHAVVLRPMSIPSLRVNLLFQSVVIMQVSVGVGILGARLIR